MEGGDLAVDWNFPTIVSDWLQALLWQTHGSAGYFRCGYFIIHFRLVRAIFPGKCNENARKIEKLSMQHEIFLSRVKGK